MRQGLAAHREHGRCLRVYTYMSMLSLNLKTPLRLSTPSTPFSMSNAWGGLRAYSPSLLVFDTRTRPATLTASVSAGTIFCVYGQRGEIRRGLGQWIAYQES